MKTISKLWILIAVLALLAPLGLILPDYFKAGSAWGEWSVEKIREAAGYVPDGLRRLSGVWNAPISDYSFERFKIGPLAGYALSSLAGIVIIIGVVAAVGKFLSKR